MVYSENAPTIVLGFPVFEFQLKSLWDRVLGYDPSNEESNINLQIHRDHIVRGGVRNLRIQVSTVIRKCHTVDSRFMVTVDNTAQ